jgi:hypothetical protein
MNILIDTTNYGICAPSGTSEAGEQGLTRTPFSLRVLLRIYPYPFLMLWLKKILVWFFGLVMLKLFVIGLFWLCGEALVQFENSMVKALPTTPRS